MSTAAKYGDLDLGSVPHVTTVEEFLVALNISHLLPKFTARGVTTIEHLLHLIPSDIDAMGIRAGVRVRLLKGCSLLREHNSSERSNVDATASGTTTPRSDDPSADVNMDMANGGVDAQRYNSTSSLYIQSTISHPDMAQICFCVSLLVHDLIQEAEASRRSVDEATSPPKNDPFTLFQPREIFALPGKRSRHEFDTDAPLTAPEAEERATRQVEIPSEDDIRLSIQSMQKLSKFSPGVLVVAMIYIERLRRRVGAELLASTWQPTLLIATIVAQKVWEDKRYMNVDFTPLCRALTLHQLNEIEVQFLQLLDYNVCVSAAVYTEWYFKLCDLCQRNSVRLTPLDSAEAAHLEITSDMHSTRLRSDYMTRSGTVLGRAGAPTRAVLG